MRVFPLTEMQEMSLRSPGEQEPEPHRCGLPFFLTHSLPMHALCYLVLTARTIGHDRQCQSQGSSSTPGRCRHCKREYNNQCHSGCHPRITVHMEGCEHQATLLAVRGGCATVSHQPANPCALPRPYCRANCTHYLPDVSLVTDCVSRS